MRLFIALDIDDGIRERIARFVEGVQAFAPDARWVKPESLHVTLRFIGEQPEPTVERIRHALTSVGGDAVEMEFRGYGFFPTTRSARVFWVGIEAGPQLASLAAAVNKSMTPLGVSEPDGGKENRPYSPHLTLARGGSSGAPHRRKEDRPNRTFQRLQEKLAALPAPEFGTMTARDFFLYQSQLSPKGSKYIKLACFTLSR